MRNTSTLTSFNIKNTYFKLKKIVFKPGKFPDSFFSSYKCGEIHNSFFSGFSQVHYCWFFSPVQAISVLDRHSSSTIRTTGISRVVLIASEDRFLRKRRFWHQDESWNSVPVSTSEREQKEKNLYNNFKESSVFLESWESHHVNVLNIKKYRINHTM